MTRRSLTVALGLLLALCSRAAAQDGTGMSVTVGKALHLTVNARMAVDARDGGDSSDERPATFDIARQRIGVEGQFGTRVEFEIEQELAGDNSWRDAYADYRGHPSLRFRAGQFKLPFSLDATTGVSHLDFVSRSRAATELAPGRDRGVMAHGRIWGKRLEYETGIFHHDGEGLSTQHPERTHGSAAVAGRLSVRPFASAKRSVTDLRVGVALADASIAEGVSNLRGHTLSGETFFPATYWVSGRRHRTGIEARWMPGPLTLTAEYMRASDDRRDQGVAGEDLSMLIASGWYVATVWRVPRAVTRWQGLQFETAARVEGLGFRSGGGEGIASTNPRAERIAPADDRTTTLGLNVYVTRRVKVLLNAIHERVRRPDILGPATAPSWTHVVSLQFAL